MRFVLALHDDWSIGSATKKLPYDENLKLSEEETLGARRCTVLKLTREQTVKTLGFQTAVSKLQASVASTV